jgi:CRP-like cAMP-binding protein
MVAPTDVQEVSLGQAKLEARALARAGDYPRALARLEQLSAAFPPDDDLRFAIADVLDQAGLPEPAADVYEALAPHLVHAGRPLRALVAARLMKALGRPSDALEALLAETYGAGSTRLAAAHTFRHAPVDQQAPAPAAADAPADGDMPALVARARARALELGGRGGYPAQLHPIPFLSELPAETLAAVLPTLTLHRLGHGQAVMRQGELGTSFYLLAGGELRVSARAEDGGERELARLYENSLFGEMALITSQPRAASVTVVEAADVLEATREALGAVGVRMPALEPALDRFTRERLIRNLLATSPLFTPFTKDQQAELLKRFEGVEVDAGSDIIRQGEPGQGLYVVLSGELEVAARPTPDQPEVRLAKLRAGDMCGEMSLLASDGRQLTTASVRALSKCNLLFLARVYVERLAAAIPEVQSHLAALAARRAEDNTVRLGARLPDEPVDIDVLL